MKINGRDVAYDEKNREWYYEDDNSALSPEESKDLEEKAKAQRDKELRMQTINDDVKAVLNILSEKRNIKIQISIYDIELDEIGVWHSKNVNYMDVLGFKTLNNSSYQ